MRKPDGDLRICADYKIGVNPKICADSYPLPNTETAFCELADMSHFATIDLANAYNQIELEESAREILTINTPIGLLRWRRLPYGVKTASAQFQAAMEATIGGLVDNMVIYQDDVCVGARTAEELDLKVAKLLEKLEQSGMQINEKKCVFRSTEIRFLGYRISASGVRPDTRLVDKVLRTKAPTCRKELESFLGLTNYYARYIQAYSERVEPLTSLRSQHAHFKWGSAQQKAFDDLKRALAAYPVIRIFDPAKRTTLTTDASEKAVSGILTQDGHPVLYLSRRLTSAEQNYSNIEREALAVVWATQRARHFLLGAKFTLNCDHQPLEFIFSPSKELPKVTSARIMRWAIQLAAFDYEISYVRGSSIPHVDAMSRLRFDEESCEQPETAADTFVHWTESDTLRLEEIRQATDADPVLRCIKRRIRDNVWSNCSVAERPYKSVRQQLTIEDGVVCLGDLVVPPTSLRPQILRAAHGDTHCGALATRNRLKREAWWPGHCEDVERYVRLCAKCAQIRTPSARTTHTWPEEEAAWQRVHIDHAHVPGVGLLLILVDAFSGWPEAVQVPDKSARTTIRVLRRIFSRQGVPKTLVSDNAPEFCDGEMQAWLQRVGCSVMRTPPYHPQSNGCAERMVQTIKRGLRAFAAHRGTFEAYLAKLLLNYRATARSDGRGSPSALMGRQLRSPLTLTFEVDAPIVYQARHGAPAEPGHFVVQAGHNTAVIMRGDARPVLAHRDQIRPLPAEVRQSVGRESGKDSDATETAAATETLAEPTADTDSNDSAADTQAVPATNPRRSDRSNKGMPPDRLAPRW
ncbi:MAG: RNase H-like domain-containing protein [Kangiellaceae bacterium]|nr:RNase H-like domain-containing protein [Kangiellaceae bacterium]